MLVLGQKRKAEKRLVEPGQATSNDLPRGPAARPKGSNDDIGIDDETIGFNPSRRIPPTSARP
jgi:hypothetical protein